MPLCKLQTSVAVPEPKRAALLASLTTLIADALGKPPRYVMITLSEGPISMEGKAGPAAFADVRSIGGLDGEVNERIAAGVCQLLTAELDIPADRVFLNFTDVPRSHWGFDGGTFG